MWHCHLAAHKNKKTTKAKLSNICLDSSAVERRTHIPEVDGSNPSRGTKEREKLICQYHVLRHAKVKPYCNIYLVRHSHQI